MKLKIKHIVVEVTFYLKSEDKISSKILRYYGKTPSLRQIKTDVNPLHDTDIVYLKHEIMSTDIYEINLTDEELTELIRRNESHLEAEMGVVDYE